jgi:Mce-associated membrane protein
MELRTPVTPRIPRQGPPSRPRTRIRTHTGTGTGTGTGTRTRAPRRPLLVAGVVLALAAAFAAAWTGWSWYGAAHDGDRAFARTRDAALAAGEQAVQNMNTLDHNDLAHGLSVWESSTTGDLHTQLVQGRADFERQVQQAQTVSTAKVLSGAVTELDARTGRASVMVALRITVQAPKSAPSVKESRLLGELTRTASGWKLSALGQAPLGDSAASTGSATASATPSPTPASPPSAGR